tara:strand:+ start:537 stop:989 length:453 start_codon:yes stop_codon:yes gene_type:complete
MIKKLTFIFCFLFLSNCGFTPIHNSKNNLGIFIESINFQGGDRDLNILIQNNLKRYQQNKLDNSYSIAVSTKYEKKTISKDKTGVASKYKLEASVNFLVKKDDILRQFRFFETFSMDRINDDFESKKYEETIKKNFANKFANDLILKISK